MLNILEKTHIPTKYQTTSIIKFKTFYEKLRDLGKHKTQNSEFARNRDKEFDENLNNLFNIALTFNKNNNY